MPDSKNGNGYNSYLDGKINNVADIAKIAQETATIALRKTEEFYVQRAQDDKEVRKLVTEQHNYFADKAQTELRLNTVDEKIAELSRPQWQTLGTVAGLLIMLITGFYGLAYGPIQDRFERTDKTISVMEKVQRENHQRLIDNTIGRPEFKEFQARVLEKNETQDSRTTRTLDRTVTSSEFQVWKETNERIIDQLHSRVRVLEELLITKGSLNK